MLYPLSSGRLQRKRSFVHAVDGVSFHLMMGETLGLVGESGCGKTTTGKLLVRLAEPTSSQVLFDNGSGELEDIGHLKGRPLKEFRRRAQMVFQDPYESMNPRRTIFDTVAEPLNVQKMGGRWSAWNAFRRHWGWSGSRLPRPSCSGFPTSFRADSVSE